MSDINLENSNKKKPLGRGLGALLGGGPSPMDMKSVSQSKPTNSPNPMTSPLPQKQESLEGRVLNVGIEKLKPGKFQPRQNFEKEKLAELAASIKVSGLLQPILVRKSESGGYEIVAGERRWRAAQIAGLHEVPVLLKTLSDQNTLEAAIVENLQRENLNPIEEAEALNRLSSEFQLNQQQIAEKVGKDRSSVANSLRLLTLPQQVRQMIIDGSLTAGHAKVLLSCQDPRKQLQLAKQVIDQKLSVRKLEKLAAAPSEQILDLKKDALENRLISGIADELQKILGTKVSIDYNEGKGKISVNFYSDEELTNLVDKFKDSFRRI